MPEILWAWGGGYAGTFGGSGGGMPQLLLAHEGVCWDFWGLREGYAGSFGGARGGYARSFWG